MSGYLEALARDAMFSYSWLDDGAILLMDTRWDPTPEQNCLESPYAEIFELAGLELATPESVQIRLEEEFSCQLDIELILDCLDKFVQRGWAINEDKRYLTLALPDSMRFFERPNSNEKQRPKRAAPVLPLVVRRSEHSPLPMMNTRGFP